MNSTDQDRTRALRAVPTALTGSVSSDPLAGQTLSDGLRVSSPSDPLEREAEATASRVMRMGSVGGRGGAQRSVQRACASCGGDAKRKGVQRKAATAQRAPSSIRSQGGSGGPLPESVRSDFEGRFGADFSDVRVHSGGQAAGLARSFNARAFTMGSDIYFGQGEYRPSSREGQRLLAHELTHVVQRHDGGGHSSSVATRIRHCDNGMQKIQRFGMPEHFENEQVALSGVLEPAEVRQVQNANAERDLSQLPPGLRGLVRDLNRLLPLGRAERQAIVRSPESYLRNLAPVLADVGPTGPVVVLIQDYLQTQSPGGTYSPEQHMERENGGVSSAGAIQRSHQYIQSELLSALKSGRGEEGMAHMGNAFHAAEDYFAHSSFVSVMGRPGSDVTVDIYDSSDRSHALIGSIVDYLTRIADILGEVAQVAPSWSPNCLLAQFLLAQISGAIITLCYFEEDARGKVRRLHPRDYQQHHSFIARDHSWDPGYESASQAAQNVVRTIAQKMVALWNQSYQEETLPEDFVQYLSSAMPSRIPRAPHAQSGQGSAQGHP